MTTTTDINVAEQRMLAEIEDKLRADASGVYHPGLQCKVRSITHDATIHQGALYMDDDNCCDLDGAIAVFKAIDPDVELIRTFAGEIRDTIYIKRGDKWAAL